MPTILEFDPEPTTLESVMFPEGFETTTDMNVLFRVFTDLNIDVTIKRGTTKRFMAAANYTDVEREFDDIYKCLRFVAVFVAMNIEDFIPLNCEEEPE